MKKVFTQMKIRSFFVPIIIFNIFLISQLGMTGNAYGQICGTSLMLPGIVSECDFCMCSQGISPLAMGGSAIRYDARYTELSDNYSNGVYQPNPTNHLEQYFTQTLSFTYGVAPDLSATLLVPFARKSESSTDPSALFGPTSDGTALNPPTSLSNTGLSDISLLARYNLIAQHTMGDTRILSATAGIKFATGSTALSDMGQPADPDLELSTGTTDFMFGLGYLQGFDNWSIGANALAGIRGIGPGYDGHKYGDNLNYDVTARYRLYQAEVNRPGTIMPSIFASLGVRGEWRGYEEQNGQPLDNDSLGWSGGNVAYLAPGAQVFFTPRISFDATVWIPFIHALNGDQLGETVKVIAGFVYGL